MPNLFDEEYRGLVFDGTGGEQAVLQVAKGMVTPVVTDDLAKT